MSKKEISALDIANGKHTHIPLAPERLTDWLMDNDWRICELYGEGRGKFSYLVDGRPKYVTVKHNPAWIHLDQVCQQMRMSHIEVFQAIFTEYTVIKERIDLSTLPVVIVPGLMDMMTGIYNPIIKFLINRGWSIDFNRRRVVRLFKGDLGLAFDKNKMSLAHGQDWLSILELIMEYENLHLIELAAEIMSDRLEFFYPQDQAAEIYEATDCAFQAISNKRRNRNRAITVRKMAKVLRANGFSTKEIRKELRISYLRNFKQSKKEQVKAFIQNEGLQGKTSKELMKEIPIIILQVSERTVARALSELRCG